MTGAGSVTLQTILAYLPPFLAIVTFRYPIAYRATWVPSFFKKSDETGIFGLLEWLAGLPLSLFLWWALYKIGAHEGALTAASILCLYVAWNWLAVRPVFSLLIRNETVLRPLVIACGIAMYGLTQWLWNTVP